MIVLDAVGAGELPDAGEYGDEGSNTLGNVASAVGGLDLPNLEALGLGNVIPLDGCPPQPGAPAVAGRLVERSKGKDTTTGHWEMMGVITPTAFPTYPHGFPDDVIDPFMNQTGRGVIGNRPASGTEIIQELGEEHQQTGKWIVYTSADSVFQIAAHEETIPLEELYDGCRVAREILTGRHAVGRVIARPFVGEPGNYERTPNRHDFSLEPRRPNYLSLIRDAGNAVYGVGKISDIFAGCDVDDSFPTKSNVDGINRTIELLENVDGGLVFVNLVETDMLWGHRNDPVNFHRCLQDFDRRLPDILEALQPGDLLIVTSDHGCDPTTASTDHSREHALLLAYAAGRNAAGRIHEEGEFARRRRDGERLARRQVAGEAAPGSPDRAVIRAAELIERKRNGEELSDEEITELVLGYTRGDVPDYQMAAWCMAVYFRGMNGRETYALTDAMIRSGETLDLAAALGRRVVDKHSTGGVGDKTSLAVGPIVAACGVPLGKMSGRGLGHTGGTLDKLESIPGFRVELTIEEFVEQVRTVGVAIIGQTGDLVPADKKLYALRDVTATVDIVPLIASSIMSKKLAGGAEAIVLDVKVGDGAFMKTLDDARILAEQMVDLGRRAGRTVVCLLTDMDQPLGAAVGNALEVREAVETISADGPPDFTELVARCMRASPRALGSRHRRRRRSRARRAGDDGRLCARSVRALDSRAGWRPGPRRASTCPDRPRGRCAARRRRVAARRAWRSASPRSSSGRAGGRRRTRSIMRSASSAARSAATSSREGGARGGARARRGLGDLRRSRRSSPRTRSATSAPPARGILLDVVE